MRPVLVSVHAHPDDESIFTGGTIVRAAAAGWRVVLVVATDGDRGTGATPDGRELAARRRTETGEAAAVLGIERVVFLGHGDSGYVAPDPRPGRATGRGIAPATLSAAHPDRVAATVRDILVEEGATAVTSYDDNGVYGHVDHVLVHRIAAMATSGTGCELYEATLDRGALRRLRHRLVGRGLLPDLWNGALADRLGVESGAEVVAVDVGGELDRKLLAVAAHSSQVVSADSFMGLPSGAFHHLLGTEWFRVSRSGDGRLLEVLRTPPDGARFAGPSRPVRATPSPVPR